jgi:hypothetical protein
VSFAITWLPNIVCTIAGCVISWGIGYRQGMRPTLMLENILVTLEKLGAVELARDRSGRITGGRNVTVPVVGMAMSLKLGQVEAHGGESAREGG